MRRQSPTPEAGADVSTAIVTLVTKSSVEVSQDILLHPAAMKSIIAAISSPPDLAGSMISEQTSANISQLLADHINVYEVYDEERYFFMLASKG